MTIANRITITRIFLSVIIFILLWYKSLTSIIIAIALFAIAAISDYIDGAIARKTNTTTAFGAIADPFADKILILAVFLAFLSIKELNVPLWAVFLIVLRELAISTLRALAALQGKVMRADKYAKLKTLSQMISAAIILLFLLFITVFKRDSFHSGFLLWLRDNVGNISFWLIVITAVLTLMSGIIYICNNMKILKNSWSKKESR